MEIYKYTKVLDRVGLNGICLEHRRGLMFRKTDADNRLTPMRQLSPPTNANETQDTEKAPFLVVKRVREAILDEVFKPGDHLGEVGLAEKSKSAGRPFGKRSSPWKKKVPSSSARTRVRL